MTARLWDELARMSELKVDRQQAQRAYKQLRKRYPQSSLVDDALFKAAKLKMDLDADRVGTLAMLEQIINMGRSKADMYAQAQDYKKALQKKNDIEKPVLATSGQGSAVVVPSPGLWQNKITPSGRGSRRAGKFGSIRPCRGQTW